MSDRPDRVLVAGASGKTGRELLSLLREREYTVIALTSSSEKSETLKVMGADEVVVGDIMRRADARHAVESCDAILCTVGASSRPSIFWSDLVDGVGVENLVDAASEADVSRFVLASAIGVGSSKSGAPGWFRLLLGRVLTAKNEGERHLQASDLTYTILRPGRLTDAPATGDVVVGEGGPTVAGSIPRADVARLMVAALKTPDATNRVFEIAARTQLRGRTQGVVEIEWADASS
ncbi:NAD(P)-binding oxidoreductase [Halococcus sp. IIIV-5B]|uniref:NAD(P)-binding oxidoreductase n=1 Tax=Halococcus sp. IIIV-5B TaxID=2321230 RepID=UPI000E70F303|nr:NAD(P)-binding oxidoreductase [Halococcus sp. IIIV-5B]RJT07118.1 NAD(P)-dependent oxidoreductase [Halococcus sp. IIIV-5B]